MSSLLTHTRPVTVYERMEKGQLAGRVVLKNF